VECLQRIREEIHIKIVVDLKRCRSYGQCVFLARKVFRFHGEQSLEYDYNPDDELRVQVEGAAAACPVQAISIGPQADDPKSSGWLSRTADGNSISRTSSNSISRAIRFVWQKVLTALI